MNVERGLLRVRVYTRAKKTGVERVSADEYRVRVLAAPSKGEANKEVIKQIAAYFDIPASQVTIVRGYKSRNKIIVLEQTPANMYKRE